MKKKISIKSYKLVFYMCEIIYAEAVKNKNKSLLNETCLNCFLMSSEYSE